MQESKVAGADTGHGGPPRLVGHQPAYRPGQAEINIGNENSIFKHLLRK
jgi:hypothetical protein